MRIRPTKRRGQATIELILTLFAFCTVFFMYIQSSLGFAISNYVQYATFMGARAYQAANGASGAQLSNATEYLNTMLGTGTGRFASVLKTKGGGPAIGPAAGVPAGGTQARLNNWQVGVAYTFEANLFLAPLIPGLTAGSGKVTLQSQSWLGAEPNTSDCVTVLQRAAGRAGAAKALFDNGC